MCNECGKFLMKTELDQDEIISEVKDNYSEDVDFYFKLIDETTNSWGPIKELIERLQDFIDKNECT